LASLSFSLAGLATNFHTVCPRILVTALLHWKISSGENTESPQQLATALGAFADPVHLVDGIPMPLWSFGRAPQCRSFQRLIAQSDLTLESRVVETTKSHSLAPRPDGVVKMKGSDQSERSGQLMPRLNHCL
jgi:hypothetical protein